MGRIRVGVVRWHRPVPRWTWVAASLALIGGLAAGAVVATLLPPARQAVLGGSVLLYARARAAGRVRVLRPTLLAWVRAAAPVWLGGWWAGGGVPVVLGALGLHGFALGLGLGVADAAGGPRGLGEALLTLLPGNLLALPALIWLAVRALVSALRPPTRPLPGTPYLLVGLGMLCGVAAAAAAEATLTPAVLRLASTTGALLP